MDKFLIKTGEHSKPKDKDEEEEDPQDIPILGGWTHIQRRQLSVSLGQLFQPNSDQSRRYLADLEREIVYLPASVSRVRVFGKWHDIPRKQAGYGDQGVTYAFSGVTLQAKPWTDALKELRDLVNRASGVEYNFVLVNRYADGKDRAGEHRDDEKELDPSAPIASLTFGATRDFYFRHISHKSGNKTEPLVKLALEDGALLLMKEPTNKFWYHALPVRKACKSLRVNLTFRKIINKSKN